MNAVGGWTDDPSEDWCPSLDISTGSDETSEGGPVHLDRGRVSRLKVTRRELVEPDK